MSFLFFALFPVRSRCVFFFLPSNHFARQNLCRTHVLGLLLLFLTFSALVANPKKTTLHGGQSRSWSAEQGKKRKKKFGSAPPPPRALLVARSEKNKKIKKSRDASTFIGATQVGVTQVNLVRLASVQGFLRLVS